MLELYREIKPYAHGLLAVGGGNRIYWETCGNPDGKPALVLHGGPGSGCTPWHRRLFNPKAYLIVLFDQRGCGRSAPHASAITTSLAANTTRNLVADIEALRRHLGIDRWLVLGGSWGSLLALAYAKKYPVRVSELVMWGVATGRRSEFDWLFRGGLAPLFPKEWAHLKAGAPRTKRDGDIPAAYARMLNSRDRATREKAALAWCRWESATPEWPPARALARRFRSRRYRLAFARIVTHYVVHNGWLKDGILLRNARRLSKIPGVMVTGRFDFQAPPGWAIELARTWPRARHVIVPEAGHSARSGRIAQELVRATDYFAPR